MSGRPRYVDHHVHVLAVAGRRRVGYDVSRPESIAEYHRRVAAAGSSPMDEPANDAGAVADLPSALRAGLQQAADLGLVGLAEAGMRDWAHWGGLVELRERGDLPLDVAVFVASGAADLDLMRAARDASDVHLSIAGVKFYADGWLGPRTCACTAPFLDVDPPDTGVLFRDAAQLATRIGPVAEAGFRPATHAIGDRAIDAVLDAYEQVYGGARGCREARPRVEHAQLLRRDLIDRIADLGVVCCIQPGFASSDAGHVESGLGGRYPEAYRWDLLLAAGVEVVAGSDFPIETLDPEVGLEQLVTGPPGLPRDVALRLMTIPLAEA